MQRRWLHSIFFVLHALSLSDVVQSDTSLSLVNRQLPRSPGQQKELDVRLWKAGFELVKNKILNL